jgi:hypothetical protein
MKEKIHKFQWLRGVQMTEIEKGMFLISRRDSHVVYVIIKGKKNRHGDIKCSCMVIAKKGE